MTIAIAGFDDGLRVVTERIDNVRSVAISVWAAVGGRDETPDQAGASHFLEHLVFKGTPSRSALDIAESVERIGGEMNAFTSREHTAYHLRLPSSRLDIGLDLLGDVLTEPAFRPHEVDAEREVILEEILMSRDTPDDRVHTLLAEALFPGHPLGREVLGDEQTVASLDPEVIRSFFDRWYRPANIVVAAAGDLDHDHVVEAIRSRFSGAADVPPVRSAPGSDLVAYSVEQRQIEQVHLAVGYRSLSLLDDDRFALALVSQILGGGMSSRLFQAIREERGLAYSVYAYNSSYTDCGAMVLYAATAPRHVDQVRLLMDEEITRLASDGISDRELANAKGYIEGSVVLGLEDTAARMSRLAYGMLYHGEIIPLDDQLARYDSVTLDDCARVIDRVFSGPRAVAAIGDVDAARLGQVA